MIGKCIRDITAVRGMVGMHHLHNRIVEPEIEIIFVGMVAVSVIVPGDVDLIPVSVHPHSRPDMAVPLHPSVGDAHTVEKHRIGTVVRFAGALSPCQRPF